MPGARDTLLRRLEQGLCDRSWIGPACDLVLLVDERRQREGVLRVLAEDIPKQLHDEFHRRVLVIVKDKLKRRVDSGKLVHENLLATTRR